MIMELENQLSKLHELKNNLKEMGLHFDLASLEKKVQN